MRALFDVRPRTFDVEWNLSGAVMPVPPYGSEDIPNSDSASKLTVFQLDGDIKVKIIGDMRGLHPTARFRVFLHKAYTPQSTLPSRFSETVPPISFFTDNNGCKKWELNLRYSDFPNPGVHNLSVWFNELDPNRTILISDNFEVIIARVHEMSISKANVGDFCYDKGVSDFRFKAELGSVGANKFQVITQKKIQTIELFIYGEEAKIHVLDKHFNPIYSKNIQSTNDPCWYIEDVSRERILVKDVFFIGVEWISENFLLGVDKKEPFYNKSYLGKIRNPGLPKSNENYMIRVSVTEPFEKDAFICHASEDKDDFVRPLAEALLEKKVKIWYDEFSLKMGDSLRRTIDKGLLDSRYGIVVLSKHFFEKEWPERELDGLVSREDGKEKVILPIWHGVSENDVKKYSPTLAGKYAAVSNKGLNYVVEEILRVIQPESLFEHLYAVFFYDEKVSWKKGERNPYYNMPRSKAIINRTTKTAFYMGDYAQNLFLKTAQGKIQFITEPWIDQDHFRKWFEDNGYELVREPASETDLFN